MGRWSELWLLDFDGCAAEKAASLGMQNRCYSYSLERIVNFFLISQTVQVPKVILKIVNPLVRAKKLGKRISRVKELSCSSSIQSRVQALPLATAAASAVKTFVANGYGIAGTKRHFYFL